MRLILILLFSTTLSRAAIVNVTTNSGWFETGPNESPGPMITNVISISCWIQPWTNYLTAGVLGCILDKGRTTATPSDSLYDIQIFTNKLRFQYMTAGPVFHRWVMDADAPTISTLTHIAVTYTYGSASSLKYYVNGVSMSGAWRSGDGNTRPASNTKPLWYGMDAVANNFRGIINEVAIWNSILTDGEIRLLTSRIKGIPLQVSPGTLVSYQPLDDLPAPFDLVNSTMKNFGTLRTRGSVEGFGAIRTYYETISSYQPNE